MSELSLERFELLKDKYWIMDFRSEYSSNEYKNQRWCGWVFSPFKKPMQMMNDSMHWRRPTYEDAVLRQEVYDNDPEYFIDTMDKKSKENRKYLR